MSFGGGAATLTVTTADTFNNLILIGRHEDHRRGHDPDRRPARRSLTAGALNGPGTLAAQGNISQASTYASGTATLAINGAGAQTFTGASTTAAGALPARRHQQAAGTLTLAGTLRTANNWTYTAGTVDPGTSTVVFAGTQTITGSQTLADVVLNNTTVHTIAAGDTLTVTGRSPWPTARSGRGPSPPRATSARPRRSTAGPARS